MLVDRSCPTSADFFLRWVFLQDLDAEGDLASTEQGPTGQEAELQVLEDQVVPFQQFEAPQVLLVQEIAVSYEMKVI